MQCCILETGVVHRLLENFEWLRAGRSENRIPVGAPHNRPDRPGAYPAFYTTGTVSLSREG